jgi:hypothetical protein
VAGWKGKIRPKITKNKRAKNSHFLFNIKIEKYFLIFWSIFYYNLCYSTNIKYFTFAHYFLQSFSPLP